jgi:4-amino-4-deoxy-L-arabinose transferase-like glycosyltransferase
MDRGRQVVAPYRSIVWLLLAATVATGVVLRCNHLSDVRSRSPDERTYTYFAQKIADEGLAAIPALFNDYVSRKELWDYPPPIRIVYPVMVAGVMKVTGWRDASAGVAVSVLASCLSLLVLAWIGVRFFNPWIALAAVCLLAFSVGELGTARRAWQDATFGFLGFLLVYVTCELTHNPRRMIWYLAFFALGAVLLLTKQTGVVSYGLCGLWAMWVLLAREHAWKSAAFLVVGGVASLAAAMAVLALCAGGSIDIALSAVDHSLRPGESALAYMAKVTAGPWYQFLDLLWLTGPATVVLALLGVAAIISGTLARAGAGDIDKIADMRAAGCATTVTLGFVLFCTFFPYMQDLRYITPANGAYCLVAGVGLCHILALAQRTLPELGRHAALAMSIGVVALGLINDYGIHTSVVVGSGMQDLPVGPIRERLRR